jgi:hypothetical protein
VSAEQLLVGEAIPAVCAVADMCRIFRLSPSSFHRREALGHFRKFELTALGRESCPKTWSGYRIARHLTGDSFSISVKRAS